VQNSLHSFELEEDAYVRSLLGYVFESAFCFMAPALQTTFIL
jgi:hypothetical protein